MKAREITDYAYFKMMIPEGWTTTHSTDEYSRYDATVTNGNKVIYTELKGRDIEITDKIKSEGAYIECAKADYLYKLGDAAIVQMFWKSNVTYVWNLKDRGEWEKVYKYIDNNNETRKDVGKWVYLLPFDEKNARYTVDLTDYPVMLENIYNKLENNEI